jgi:hypothetical protein
MGQVIQTSFVCNGRYRIHSIGRVGQHAGRIIEIEEVDTGKRVHGPPQRLRKMLFSIVRRSLHEDGRDRD